MNEAKKHIAFLLLMLSCFIPSYSTAQPLHLSFQLLTELEGLRPAEQYFITQDSRDYIWIGTDDGLQRFDGQQLVTYQQRRNESNNLPENKITSSCFEDSAGDLWFSTPGYLNCYRYESNDFLTFSLPEQKLNDYRLFHLDDKGLLWLQIGKGDISSLWQFDPQESSFTQSMSLPGGEPHVISDEQGKAVKLVSMGLPNQSGLSITDLIAQQLQTVSFTQRADGRDRSYASPTQSCYVDADGNIWTGIYNGLGLWEPGQKDGLVIDDRIAGIEDFEFVRKIVDYGEHHLLVAADKGFALFDKRRRSFVHQFKENGQNPNVFTAVKEPNQFYLDHQGNIWVGGAQGQLAYANLNQHKFSIKPSTVGQSIVAIDQDAANNVWVSTQENGTYVYAPDGSLALHTQNLNNVYYPNESFPLPPIYFFLTTPANDWWGNLENYFFYWNKNEQSFDFKGSYYFEDPSLSTPEVSYCYQRSDNSLLTAIGGEVYSLVLTREKADTMPWHKLKYLQLETVTFIHEDQQQLIYIGDEAGRMLIFQEQNEQLIKLADHPDIGRVSAACENEDVIWLATAKGLVKLNPQTLEYTLLTEKSDGIPETAYKGVFADHSGYLWLTGKKGLVRYHPDTKTYHHFSLYDGLLSTSINVNSSLYVPQTGEIWLGGNNGVNVFHPDSLRLSDIQPRVHFSRFLVNDVPHEWSDSINRINNVTLSYEENTVSFEFAALDYSAPDANNYFYQLEGVDELRIASGKRKFVRYANLPAKTYTFNVWATNPDGILNPDPKSLTFTVTPPYYQTWWFYLLCFLFTSAVVYGVFQYRLEQVLKMERLRVKISSDLHDDVGGMLSGLAMQTELLERIAPEESKPRLANIAAMSRNAMSRMRDTVWAIDSRNDKLEDLLDRMREHAEETLEAKAIQYTINTINIDDKLKLATDVKQSLYLIFKEAITNVAKHSDGDTVNVNLSMKNTGFEMAIHDNGKSKEKSYKTTGLGTSNMQMRANSIGATLEINNEEGFLIVLRRKSL